MGTISIDTVCIHITNMAAIVALIDICKKEQVIPESKVTKAMFISKLLRYSDGLFNVPEHTCPFPVYPSLQEQLWEPLVLVQFAFTSQT